jgi:hypothetical protein
MKVIARWTIAYKGISYNGGQQFELDAKDFEKYKKDVEIVKDLNPSPRNMKTKEVKTIKTK